MTDKPRRQCKTCPWRVDVDPHDIPNGYCAVKHAGLENTIARSDDPFAALGRMELRLMACHKSPIGRELPCVGWLDNQLNQGNNLMLRLAVHLGRVSANYRTVGKQHQTFEETLPRKR